MKYNGKIRTRVRKAALKLDKVHPDWWIKINVHVLNLGSASKCVLGQLYGSWGEGGSYDLADGKHGKAFGKNLTSILEGKTKKYTEAWLKEIEYRRYSWD